MNDANSWPIGSLYEALFAGSGGSTTTGPTRVVMTRELGRRVGASPLAVATAIERLDLGIPQMDYVMTRVKGPIRADVFDVGTSCTGRLEDLAHWTGNIGELSGIAHAGGSELQEGRCGTIYYSLYEIRGVML